MIRIYEQGYNDFSSNGLGQLHPTRCVVREQQGGVYDLEIDHPMDETLAYDFLKNGRIIKVPVPAVTTPMHKIKGVESEEWWKADADGKAVYSVKSTDVGYSQTVTKTKTVLTEKVLPRAAASASMDMEYMGNHPRDTGVIYEKKPVTYTESEWVPGSSRVVDRVRKGQLFLVLDKTDSSWWQVTTSRGQTGWMQTGGISHDHTVVGRLDETVQEKKIRDQLFRIYKTEKDTDAGEVRAWARHIYYDLLGNVVMEGVYKEVTLGDLLPQLEANCSQPGHGFQFHTDAPLTNLKELDYTHKNMVEAQLDPDDGVLAKGNLRMVRDNFDVYFTGRSQTKRAPITYGRNLLGVTLEIDEDGVVNRIVPIGSNKDGDPVLLDQKWVDSPNLAEGDLIRAKTIEYSDAREKDAREATENSPSEPAVTIAGVKEMLLEKANEEYDKGIDLPDVELTVDFIQLGDTDEYQQFRELDRVYLSDLVQITDLVHGIDVEAEVTEYDFDCLTGRYTKIKVGVTSAGRTIGTVDGFMLPNGGVGGTKLARGGVDASRLQNLSITSAKIGVAQIQQAHIQDAAIDTAQIKNAAITTAKIGDAQVDTAQIKNAAIQTAKIGDLQVSNAKIANGTIETAKIKDAAITTAKIQDAQITNAKIAAAGIDFANIKDLVAGTGIFRQGVGDALYLDRLVVNDANFASAIAGKLMIRDTDGKLYRISVNSSGAVTATQVQVNGDSLTDNAVMSVSQRLLWRQATQPSAPWVGMLWHDTTTGKLKRCTAITPSVAWEVVPAGEVHTAVIDVDDNGMNILSGGDLNLLAGGNLNIKNLGNTANVINMDSTGLTLSSTGQLKLQSTDSIVIGGSPFSVGGTNLIPNSDFSQGVWYTYQVTAAHSHLYRNKSSMSVTVASDKDYGFASSNIAPYAGGGGLTVSGTILGYLSSSFNSTIYPNEDAVFRVRYYDSSDVHIGSATMTAQEVRAHPSFVSGTFCRVSKSFGAPPAGTTGVQLLLYCYTANNIIRYAEVQVEQGTMATDWSPSPQDTVDALDALDGRLGDVETRVQVFYQDSKPTYTAVGDLWYDTDSNPLEVWKCTNVSTQAHTAFTDPVLTRALSAQTTANSKINTFVGDSTPTALAAGDLWLDTGNKNIWKRATAAGTGGWMPYLTAAGYVNSTGITIDGTDLTVKATGNLNLAADGNMNVQNGGNLNVLNGGDIEINNGGDINVAAGGKITLTTSDDLMIGAQNIRAFAETIDLSANNSIKLAVSGIQVGGANLITNSDWTQGLDWGKHPNAIVQHSSDSFDGKKYINLTCPAGTSAVYIFRDTGPIDLSEDTEFTVSVWQRLYSGQYAKWPVNGNFVQLVWLDGNDQQISFANFDKSHISTASGWQRFVGKATVPATTKKLRLTLYTLDNSGTGNVCAYANAQVQEGNKVTPWGPHKDDPASGVKTSSVEVNSNGIYMDTTGTFNVNAGVGVNIKGGSGASSIGISNNDANNYFLWAGHGTPASAPFSVKMDGSVKATKIQHEMPYTFWDMADASVPAEFPIYIPSGYTIDSVTVTFKTNKARTFAKSASSGGGFTTPAGDWLTGGVKDSVSTGTPSANNTGSASPDVSGFSGGVSTGSAGDSAHTHNSGSYGAASHSHGPGNHTHTMGHQHSISAHTHQVDAHSHGLDYGINEKSALATSCVLKVGATTIGTYSPNPSNPVEVKAYMSAGWNTVTVTPNNDARIVAYAMVKVTPA